MPREELKRTLESLHEELSQSAKIDPEVRKLLTDVARDIEQTLQEEPPASESEAKHSDLIDRVNNLASHFEEQHPTLAQIIGRIANGALQLSFQPDPDDENARVITLDATSARWAPLLKQLANDPLA